uniref:Uncharacterized protein n=1 Tax=Dromaius novaehollandiae TaxID=8790 RepID=A0A8C4KD46_DRONO
VPDPRASCLTGTPKCSAKSCPRGIGGSGTCSRVCVRVRRGAPGLQGEGTAACPLLLAPPFLLLAPLRLQKQQWQQMKTNAMRTTKGRPISTARQTVLKTPSSCLVRMRSKMELKKELIFCSMSAPVLISDK